MSDLGKTKGMITMEQTILEMQENLTDGLFIAFIGLQSAGVVVADASTIVTLGDITSGSALLALIGVILLRTLPYSFESSSVIYKIFFYKI